LSGGYFDYKQYEIECIADEIARIVEINDTEDGHGFNEKILNELKNGVKLLRKSVIYAQRIDWLLEGDDDEKSFIERLKEDLGNDGNKDGAQRLTYEQNTAIP
jgi:hypothetical protein